MQRNYTLNAGLRIVVTTEYPFNEENPFYDFPDDFDFAQQYDYKIIDNALVYDPIPAPPEPEPQPSQTEINTANIEYIAMMTDVELPESEV